MSGDKTAGQWAGTIIGAVVGFYTGNVPGAIQGAAIGAGIGGYVDPPKGPSIKGPRLGDAAGQASRYGEPLVRGHGKFATHGTIIYLENNQLKEVAQKKKQGGKGGGGGSTTVTTYSYFATFAVALADVPPDGIKGVGRIWIGPNLVYNGTSLNTETIIASKLAFPFGTFGFNSGASNPDLIRGKNGVKFKVYPGADDQQPDTRIQSALGVGTTPAWRGTCYIVLYDLPLKDWGNSLVGAQVKVELIVGDITSQTTEYIETLDTGVLDSTTYSGSCSLMDQNGSIIAIRGRGGSMYQDKVLSTGAIISTIILSSVKTANMGWIDIPGWSYQHSATAVVTNGNMFAKPVSFASNRVLKYGDTHVIYWYAPTGTANFAVHSYSDQTLVTSGTIVDYYSFAIIDEDTMIAIAVDGITISIFDIASLSLSQSFSLGVVWPNAIPSGVLRQQSTSGCVADGIYYILDTRDTRSLLIFDYINGIELERRVLPLVGYMGSVLSSCIDATNGILSVYINGSGNQTAKISKFKLNNFNDAGVLLSDVVEDELLRSEYISENDLDVTDLSSDIVTGYRLAGVQQVRACVNPLMGAWPFDLIQSGYKIKAVRRGNSSAVTINEEQLDARRYGESFGTALAQSREMDSQLPRQVALTYLDPVREHESNVQYSVERLSSNAADVRQIEMPIVFSANEAAEIADMIFNLAWERRSPADFNLPPTYINLEPSDVVTITTDDASYEYILTQINYLPDGRLECRGAEPNSAAIYTQTDSVGGTGQAPDENIVLSGESIALLLDIPLIRNEDDEPLFALAMAGTTESWPGGILYRSTDNEQTWTAIQGSPLPVTMGYARSALGAHDCYIIDRQSTLTIDLIAGELDSITEVQMMTGLHWCAYGADQRWELLRFVNATLNADGSYTIDTLLRGLRGTEQFTGTHAESDAFVFLDDADVYGIGADLQFLNITRKWRAVTESQSIDDVASVEFAYRGVNLKPLSGVLGEAVQSGSDWIISWEPRSRLYGSLWTTGVDIPIGEAAESYQIDIMDGADVVNTYTATTNTYTYTAAQQTTDWGSTQSSLTVNVYMISADVGRGYPLEIAA